MFAHIVLERRLTVNRLRPFTRHRESLLRHFSGRRHLPAEVRKHRLLHSGFEAGRLKSVVSRVAAMTVFQRTHVLSRLLPCCHVLHGYKAIGGPVSRLRIEHAEGVCFVEAVCAGDSQPGSRHHRRFGAMHAAVPIFSGS